MTNLYVLQMVFITPRRVDPPCVGPLTTAEDEDFGLVFPSTGVRMIPLDTSWYKILHHEVAIMNYSLFFSSDASCSTSPGPNQSLSDSVIKRQAVTSMEKAGCGAVRGTRDDRKGLSALPATPSLLLQVKYTECMDFYLAPTSYFQDSYLTSLSNCQIKQLLKARGESIGGKKMDLIARLKKTVGSSSLEV